MPTTELVRPRGPIFRNDANLHPALYKALTTDSYDHDKAGDISATGLIKPPKMMQLGKKYGHLVEKDASSMLWAVLGTAIHSMIESGVKEDLARIDELMRVARFVEALEASSDHDKARAITQSMTIYLNDRIKEIRGDSRFGDTLTEERIGIDMIGPKGKWHVTCKTDMFELFDDSINVLDWKVTGTFGYTKECQDGNNGVKPEWEQQLNINSYIIKKHLGWRSKGLQVGVIFRDWKQSELEKYIHKDDASFPAYPVMMVDIPLWSETKQADYIMERLAVHQNAVGLSDEELPECTKKERWERGEKWAVMTGKTKRAVKLLDDPAEADLLSAQTKNGRVEHRPAKAVRCESWCDAKPWCSFAQEVFNLEKPGEGEIISL